MPNQREDLNPWRVIVSCLFEHVRSFEIPQIIDRSGLPVNWLLTEREDYSETYRKAAYTRQIYEAYDDLSNEDHLRVAYIVSEELIRLGHSEILDVALRRIGWCIQSGRLSPDNAHVQELFFPPQSQHDAYVVIRDKFAMAHRLLKVIDPYLDSTIFTILARISQPRLQVHLLTLNLPSDFNEEAQRFLDQYQSFELEIRRSRNFHDRFIIIDDHTCWHIGCSIKDAGNRAFMLSKVEDKPNRDALLAAVDETWSSATQIFP